MIITNQPLDLDLSLDSSTSPNQTIDHHSDDIVLSDEYTKLSKSSPQTFAFIQKALKSSTSSIVVSIPAHLIKISRFANREESEFKSESFTKLRDNIELSAGNITPIIVRVICKEAPAGRALCDQRLDSPSYEIVAGHRRYRACRELGLNVKALVVPSMTDAELFLHMQNENAEREKPCPYAEGKSFKLALAGGYFKNQIHLAKSLPRDPGDVSRAIALADLPDWLVNAFASPADLQFHDAKLLNDAMKSDCEAMQMVATQIAESGEMHPRSQVMKKLLDAATGNSRIGPSNFPKKRDIRVKDKAVATSRRDASNCIQIRTLVEIPEAHMIEFEAAIAKAIAKATRGGQSSTSTGT